MFSHSKKKKPRIQLPHKLDRTLQLLQRPNPGPKQSTTNPRKATQQRQLKEALRAQSPETPPVDLAQRPRALMMA